MKHTKKTKPAVLKPAELKREWNESKIATRIPITLNLKKVDVEKMEELISQLPYPTTRALVAARCFERGFNIWQLELFKYGKESAK